MIEVTVKANEKEIINIDKEETKVTWCRLLEMFICNLKSLGYCPTLLEKFYDNFLSEDLFLEDLNKAKEYLDNWSKNDSDC